MENEKLFELMTQMYSEMQAGFKMFDSRFAGIDSRVTGLESEMRGIKKVLLQIEQDHGKKLEVLFDGITQHTDQLKRIEERLSKHDEFILTHVK